MKRFAVALAAFAAPGLAAAQDSGVSYYLDGSFLLGAVRDVDATTTTGAAVELEYDTGYGFAIAGGAVIEERYDFGLELSYLEATTETATTNALGSFSVESEFSAISLIATAGYQHPLESGFTPYIGVGFGVAFAEQGAATAANGFTFVEGEETIATAMFRIGVDYQITDKISIGPSYRMQWFDSEDLTVDALQLRARYVF